MKMNTAITGRNTTRKRTCKGIAISIKTKKARIDQYIPVIHLESLGTKVVSVGFTVSFVFTLFSMPATSVGQISVLVNLAGGKVPYSGSNSSRKVNVRTLNSMLKPSPSLT